MNKTIVALAFAWLLPAAVQAQAVQARAGERGPVVVSGVVRDSSGTLPLSSVYLKNRPSAGISSDGQGAFLFRAERGWLPDTLVFSQVGYREAYFPLAGDRDTVVLAVRLHRAEQMLRDVVVSARKNDWKKLDRQSQARFNDALLTSAIHERRFVFRVTEIRPLNSNAYYLVMPGVNYMVIDRDSITVKRFLAGSTYVDRRGNSHIVDYVPESVIRMPVVSYQERENKGGIRVTVTYRDQGALSWTDFDFSNGSGGDAMVVTMKKTQYRGYVESLGYPTLRKEMLRTVGEGELAGPPAEFPEKK